MAKITDIIDYSNELLGIDKIKDYCPNGLQVAGKTEVNNIVSGVTASRALLDAAIKADADLILVHHGYFWKGEDQRIVNTKFERIKRLILNKINLAAYHLPLDIHAKYGNNVQLAKLLGFKHKGFYSTDDCPDLIAHGVLNKPMHGSDLSVLLARKLERSPLHIPGHERNIEHIAWCTGGAQSLFAQALAANPKLDAYITGEVSEQTTHLAREAGG